MWVALLGTGGITIGFSFLFGTRSSTAQVLMTSALAMTIAVVLVSILAWRSRLRELPAWTLMRSTRLRTSSTG